MGQPRPAASNGWVTVREILLGYLAAVVLGVALAVSTSRIAERACYPWLVISQTVPVPVIAPIFVVRTAFDIRPKLMVIALVTFSPIVVNTVDGLKSTDPELLNLLRTLGAGRSSSSATPGCRPRCRSCSRACRSRWCSQ